MQIEVLDQRRSNRTVAEAHVLELQFARQSIALKAPRGFVRRIILLVDMILHHIVEPLHLHLRRLQRRAQGHQLRHRLLELSHQRLKCHEHAREAAHRHDQRRVHARRHHRTNRQRQRFDLNLLLGRQHLRTIARPHRKQLAFTAVGFDRFDHSQAVRRNAVLFALILLHLHVQVDQISTQDEKYQRIERAHRHADQRQRHAVLEQQQQEEQRNDHV